jgi:hypothetical protein
VSLIRDGNDGGDAADRSSQGDPLLGAGPQKAEFEFTSLLPGLYVLAAGTGSMSARVPVEIGNADIDDLRIVLAPAINVMGRVAAEPSPNASTTLDLRQFRVRIFGNELRQRLTPSSDGTFSVYLVSVHSATPAPDGGFTLQNVAPGSYQIEVESPKGWYVKSARIANNDVSSGVLKVDREALGRLDIAMGRATGTLDLVVLDDDQRPSPATTIALVPATDRRKRSDLYRTVTADAFGRARIEDIAPGVYRAFAWLDIENDAWLDPDTLQLYESQGVDIEITGAGAQNVRVRAIPAR